MNTEAEVPEKAPDASHLSIADKWISSRFEQTALEFETAMANYRFDLASQTLYTFIWNEYCDWYLELSKPILWDEAANPEPARATRWTLLIILEKSLRLLHPFMPFITEEIWQKIAPLLQISGDSIMLQSFPTYDEKNIDKQAEEDIEWIKGVIIAIRNIRGEMDISPAKSITAFLRKGSELDKTRLKNYRPYLQKLAKLNSIEWLDADEEAPVAATALHQDIEILVPLAGLIDVVAERARLEKEIAKLESGLKAVAGKLGNENFVDKAPAAVVEKERAKQQQMASGLTVLQQKLNQLQRL